MIGAYRITAYVIASADGRIADASGVQPASLQLDADRRYFENGLDHVDAVVHGRHSQEGHPNSAGRRRLILTRSVPALAPDPDNPKARLWNPAGASFEEACAALGLSSGTIAVIGGPAGLHALSQAGLRLLPLEPGGEGLRFPTACRSSFARRMAASRRRRWRPPASSPARPLARRRGDRDRLGAGRNSAPSLQWERAGGEGEGFARPSGRLRTSIPSGEGRLTSEPLRPERRGIDQRRFAAHQLRQQAPADRAEGQAEMVVAEVEP